MPGSQGSGYEDMLTAAIAGARAGRQAGEEEAGEELGPCAARPTARWLPGVHVFRRRGSTRSFQFAHLGYQEYDPGNTWFVIEFNEPEKWRLTVRGRNLWAIYNYLAQHRLEWIREADRDFAGDNEAIITAIDIVAVKETAGQGGTG
jgi:hypothetical protein